MRPLYVACESLWAAGFALAGRLARASRPHGAPLDAARVLAIAPHPDDEVTGCGGALALHSRGGAHVSVLQITDGQGARALHSNGQSIAVVRRDEARAAAAALGVARLEQLAWPERIWREDELRAVLRARLTQIEPEVVYAPSCIDFHPDHLRVARAFAAALGDTGARMRVRLYEITVPLTARLANCVVDTSAVRAAHDAAIAAYPSQFHALRAIVRMRMYRARYYGAPHSAEVFWELSPREYQMLMARGDWLGAADWSSRGAPFRSLRDRPFTDPLAYWQGRRARRAWQSAIAEAALASER